MPYSVSPRLTDHTVVAEADEVLRDLDAELLGRVHVADLVQGDRDRDAERRTPRRRARRSGAFMRCSTSSRRPGSRAQRVGAEHVRRGSVLARRRPDRRGARRATARHRVDDAEERQPPGEERVDAHLVGRVEDRRAPSARTRPASRASATAGNASSSSGKNSQVVGLRPVARPAAASGHPVGPGQARARSAAACPAAMPGPSSSRRRTRPSSGRPTGGCTTTSMRSKAMPNSRCASITSSPLLTSVAELIVTTGPMSQVGCASACSGVTSASSARRAPAERPTAGGEDQPADLVAALRRAGLRERRVLGVDRHDLARARRRRHERRRR